MTDTHEPSWRQELQRRLDEERPDRYTPGEDDDWLEAIVADVAPQVAIAEAQEQLVRGTAQRLERRAMRRGNTLLRDCLKQPVLDPAFFDLPLSVGAERVAFRAMSPEDFRLFASEERRRNAHEFTVREESCLVAEELADRMEQFGWAVGAQIQFE